MKTTFEGHAVYDVDLVKLLADVSAQIKAGTKYGYGVKAKSTTPPGLVRSIDCSGEVVYLGKRRGVPIDGGSQQLREWAIKQGLKESTPETCFGKDVLYLFVLPVTETRDIGHTGFILNGRTIESHGGKIGNGVDRRDWRTLTWADECRVFVLARPKG